jgi:sugar lactone lactonase YvrE
MRVIPRLLALLSVALVLYLLFWPVDFEPGAWDAPDDHGLVGAFASNGKLAHFEWLLRDVPGPEAMARDERGRLFTGALDGRVLIVDEQGQLVRTLANTRGRPLGLKTLPDGSLVVADTERGLLHVDDAGNVRVIVDHEGKTRFAFVDDVDVLPDGRFVFSNASQRFGLSRFELDILEHSNTGALYLFDPRSNKLTALARNLSFANGVAASKDGSYVLVNETGSYRVSRVWLSGPRRGQREIIINNLPGFPDNITYDKKRDLFWVALASPRDAGLDLMSGLPALRKVVARLPASARPQPKRHAMALAMRGDGRVVHFFDDPAGESYSPVTGVLVTDDYLYLSSYQHSGIARLKLGDLGLE